MHSLWMLLVLLYAVVIQASDITNVVFGAIKEGVVAAFGDFNSDELTDIFIIQDDRKMLQILYGADTEPLLRIGPICYYDARRIVSVIPGDFDGDAVMDVMVNVEKSKDIYDVYINWGNTTMLNCSKEPTIQTKGEAMALDFNHDMIIDLYGLDVNNTRCFWIFNNKREPPQPVPQAMPTGGDIQTLVTPNANAYLDLNGDYIADLFLQTKTAYEIWYGINERDGQENFSYQQAITYELIGKNDYVVGQAVFMDFELRGVQNIVVPYCVQENCKNSTIFVHDGEMFYDVHVNFKDPQGVIWAFVPPDPNDVYLKTITARSGDFNLDGYPDLLVTLQPLNVANPVIQTFLLENKACIRACSMKFKRTFEVHWSALAPLGSNTVAGAFYDFYQDGVLDVILMEKLQKGGYRPLAFRNTLDYDANFVKVIVLTGLVNPQNPTLRTPLGRKKRTYGSNLPGPIITYSTTTQDGDQQSGSSVQLPQSSYFALQLPYTCFGLGRTPNFVDQLVVGLYGKWHNWTQLIPNSQIIVVPKPLDQPQHWKALLFVTPSKLILMSVVALGGTCLVIVLIILVLYIKEKREDRQERLQESHRFHFDAM